MMAADLNDRSEIDPGAKEMSDDEGFGLGTNGGA